MAVAAASAVAAAEARSDACCHFHLGCHWPQGGALFRQTCGQTSCVTPVGVREALLTIAKIFLRLRKFVDAGRFSGILDKLEVASVSAG